MSNAGQVTKAYLPQGVAAYLHLTPPRPPFAGTDATMRSASTNRSTEAQADSRSTVSVPTKCSSRRPALPLTRRPHRRTCSARGPMSCRRCAARRPRASQLRRGSVRRHGASRRRRGRVPGAQAKAPSTPQGEDA
ncbi:hypothetical protein B0H17DRAFT_1331409 [Mycena rosella]|uniref:Uncharacterized protein n=1 Tax=Mycena rosella TaxID=1033263 RepID=A0AAD7GIE7_MYCRO|nr:hypothetical protein B0H17DRAFT_1331409 [Mycena rosella]